MIHKSKIRSKNLRLEHMSLWRDSPIVSEVFGSAAQIIEINMYELQASVEQVNLPLDDIELFNLLTDAMHKLHKKKFIYFHETDRNIICDSGGRIIVNITIRGPMEKSKYDLDSLIQDMGIYDA